MTDKNSRPKAAKAAQNANKAQNASEAARLPEPEDFWLELGPPSAYYGTDAYDAARQNGDASPDAERLGWTGAEPVAGGQGQ